MSVEMSSVENELILLPHHEQMPLCTSRQPYRQGRNLTAVKVYSVVNESNHLLIFGVPSLNLRQEIKAQFLKFGKLSQFNLSKNHAAEQFTETYHAVFERIQSARLAKKMLDTKNFYGGSLHVCYAPEYENVAETKQKLLQRQQSVLFRLRNLQKESVITKVISDETVLEKIATVDLEKKETEIKNRKLNMGEMNVISFDDAKVSRKRLKENKSVVIEKKFKPCFIVNNEVDNSIDVSKSKDNTSKYKDTSGEVEVIDFTSTETDTLTNINETLNYNNFGSEVVRKVANKPVSRIKFYVNNKSL